MHETEEPQPNLNETFNLIEEKFQQLQKRQENMQTVILYQPNALAKENRYIMLVRVEIEYALRLIVAAHRPREFEKQPSSRN